MNLVTSVLIAALDSRWCAIDVESTSDLATVHALRHQLLRQGPLSPFGVASDADTAPGTIHVVARLAETVVGVCTFVASPCPNGASPGIEIVGMAVLEAHQRRGVGSALLRYGLATAPDGCNWIWAKARCTALDFYVRQGFRPVSDVYDILPGVPHRTVIRPVDPHERAASSTVPGGHIGPLASNSNTRRRYSERRDFWRNHGAT